MAKQILNIVEGDIGLVLQVRNFVEEVEVAEDGYKAYFGLVEQICSGDENVQEFVHSDVKSLDEFINLMDKDMFWRNEHGALVNEMLEKFHAIRARNQVVQEFVCEDGEYCVFYVVIFEGNEEEFELTI